MMNLSTCVCECYGRTWLPGGDGGAWRRWPGTSAVVCQHCDVVSSARSKSGNPRCRFQSRCPHPVGRRFPLMLPPVSDLSATCNTEHVYCTNLKYLHGQFISHSWMSLYTICKYINISVCLMTSPSIFTNEAKMKWLSQLYQHVMDLSSPTAPMHWYICWRWNKSKLIQWAWNWGSLQEWEQLIKWFSCGLCTNK